MAHLDGTFRTVDGYQVMLFLAAKDTGRGRFKFLQLKIFNKFNYFYVRIVAVALTNSKTEAAYTKIIENVFPRPESRPQPPNKAVHGAPKIWMSDFENPLRAGMFILNIILIKLIDLYEIAMKARFPDAFELGCWFHWVQCVWRNRTRPILADYMDRNINFYLKILSMG